MSMKSLYGIAKRAKTKKKVKYCVTRIFIFYCFVFFQAQ